MSNYRVDFQKVIEDSQASIEKTDLACLLPILETRSPKYILEIGTWKGYSAKVWYEAFHPIQNLITIEKESEHFPYSYQPNNLEYVHGDSHDQETFERIKDSCEHDGIDFLFIDGDHTYNGVRKDFEMYGSLVREGGVIVFHDVTYINYDVQVKPFWEELKITKNYVEIKTTPRSTGIGVLFID